MWKTRRRHLLTMGAPPPHIIINQVKLSVLLPRSLVDRFPTILYEDLVKTSQRTNNAVSHAWQGFAPLPPVRFDLYLGGPLVGCRRDFEIACIVSRALWDTRFPFSIRPGDWCASRMRSSPEVWMQASFPRAFYFGYVSGTRGSGLGFWGKRFKRVWFGFNKVTRLDIFRGHRWWWPPLIQLFGCLFARGLEGILCEIWIDSFMIEC